ncbi:MAG: SDR family oxidoreductase [Deltaproteobacteria bacterium]|nr:SDR family oxidoreductase [Deltaproteobacteria bacterium]MBW2061976.1 SDR family oxidoreductase [Deltaproteobacteria bacterium]MBW2087200.1 SDR family oxidoreductase [Deltaproteobacteria bacterium]
MGLLDGKVAIVTGAGRGIGKSEAVALANEGAKVVVNDLGGSLHGAGSEAMVADEVVKEINDSGGTAAANYSDISTLDGADAMIWTALSRFGRLDILVNNAGIIRDRTLLNMSEEDWDLVLKVHAKGTFMCARAAARKMRIQNEGGVIINTTSMSGLIGNFGQINYGLAKAGMYAFTKIAAMELARYGIRVHAVCPNAYTRMTADLPGFKDITEEMLSPDAIAPVVVFLASDLAKDLNGRVIGAHGGVGGGKVYEFKMTVADGYFQKKGLPSALEIAENIGQVLNAVPDLNMLSVMQAE